MLKKLVLNFLKLALTLGLLYWLVQSGKLDWSLLAEMRRYPLRLMLVFGFCGISLGLIAWRLRYILSARASHGLSFTPIYFVTWIGMFFSSVLPGSVTGDFIKIWYLKKQDSNFSTGFLLFSCLLDRLMGLTGLILLMGFFSIVNYYELIQLSSRLAPLLHFNFLLFGLVFLSLVLFFFFPKFIDGFLNTLPNTAIKTRLISLWTDLIASKKQVAAAIFISLLVQFMSVVIFHLLVSPQYTTDLSLNLVLSFIPLGFMVLALPISPGGLGVGHVAFQSLFSFAGEMNGANLFNMYFVVIMFFNLLGFIPWILMREKTKN
jgi:glycosyltransferase 2 family protein